MDGTTWLAEYDQEMANTRKVLERVPDERLDFRPHPKSYTLHDLAAHLSNIPTWTEVTFTSTELDLAQPWERDIPDTVEGMLEGFDRAVAQGRAALEKVGSEDMQVGWTLRTGNQVWFTMPRGVVLRSFVLNHMIHHRAQLTVYLRLLDVPVPGVYGPSADEQ